MSRDRARSPEPSPADGTLIIKLGAMGDVLRTTSILHVLRGPITWVTRPASVPLLENVPQIAEIVTFDQAPSRLAGRRFRVAACLDDEPDACKLLDLVHSDARVGAYLDAGGVVRYGDGAAPWYDMGLASRFGKVHADALKQANQRSYQEFLFAMFGQRFAGQEYVFGYPPRDADPKRIGIETRADARWRWKRWVRFPELVARLQADGFDVFEFVQRDDLRDFIADVNACSVVLTGDTLTMHVALALRKRVVAIFGPTSAPEIHDYGRLRKVVSPIECICCYLRECDKQPNCMDLITTDRLHAEVVQAARGPA